MLRYVVLVALGLLSACKGSHLYNKADHELAKQAQEAFKEADLSASIKEERKLTEEISQRGISVVRRHVIALRDGWLLWLIAKEPKDLAPALKKKIDERKEELAGDGFDEFIKAVSQLRDDREELRAANDGLALAKKAGVTGTALKGPEKRVKTAKEKIEALETSMAVAKGELGKLNKQVAELTKAQADLTGAINQKKKDYAAAKKKAQSAPAGGLAKAAKKMQAAVKELDKPLGKVSAAGKILAGLGLKDLEIEGKIARVQDQLDDIDILLNVIVKGEADKEKTPKGKGAARLHGVLSWSIPLLKEVGTAARYPRVSALLLEAERLRIDLDAAKQRLARATGIAALMESKRMALLAEVLAVRRAEQALGDLKPTSPRFAEYRARALIEYANTWTLGRTAQEEADFMIIALRHRAALDGSETALAQWENMISVPLGQLVALYGSGVTADEIAKLAAAAGLAGIAGGVS